MIVDSFMFFNELDLLEIRLNELSSVVDRFVLVESRESFSLAPKPLYFLENRARFRDFLPRIQHVIIDRFERRDTTWAAEAAQRDRVARELEAFGDDDILIHSDIDEIPNHSVFHPGIASDGPVALEQPNYYCYVNCLSAEPLLQKTKVFRRRHLTVPIKELREARHHPVITAGGWHFSYLGGADSIKTKMAAYSHQELNRSLYTSKTNFARAIRAGRVHFDSSRRLTRVDLDETFPRYLLDNAERFSPLIAPPNTVGVDRWARWTMQFTHGIEHLRIKAGRAPGKLKRILRSRTSGRA